MTKFNLNDIDSLIEEQLKNNAGDSMNKKKPRKEPYDHEGAMARSEIRSMLINGMKLYKMIGSDDQLPGWVSAYITLSSDYINSVADFMSQEKVDEK